MHILVTGGAGYIGSMLTQKLLSAEYKVSAIDSLWFRKDVPLLFIGNPLYSFYRGKKESGA